MSKRNKIVITTPESKALKVLREKSGLSLRKLADRMNLSMTRVHQYELGKENVSEPYIKGFLLATNISVEEWNNELGSPSELYLLRKMCADKVNEIEESKLELVYGLLSNF
jgi:transcriptional regulator with XRE-family HTH domain